MKPSNATKQDFVLKRENIDAVCAHLDVAPAGAVGRRELLRLRLAVEEILCRWKSELGEETVCTIWCAAPFGQRSIRLSAPGPSADPTANGTEDELSLAASAILEKLGLTPSFRYEKGVNLVTIRLSAKKSNPLIWIGLAAALAIVLGLASLLLPTGTRMMLTDELATPALGMLLDALSGVAMPMIFFSICISIVSIGDIATLGKIGKKLLSSFLGVTAAVLALAILAVAWLFPITTGSASADASLQTILSMLFDVVPTNMASPFLDGNVLQIIFLGGCFGVAFLMLGERARLAVKAMRQLDQAVSLLMAGINRLIPVFVFLTFYTLVASGATAKLGGAVKIIVLVAAALVLMMLIFTVVLCLRLRVRASILILKLAPAFLVALSTASSIASYPIRLETCKKRLGVDERTAHFCIPLAQALFKPSVGILYCCSALCIAQEYGVQISLGWLVLCLVVSGILAVATPPVPGGAKMAFAALFAQLGIPAEGLVLALAADTLLDFLWTAANTYVQMALTVLCCDKLGLVDRTALATAD